jgi:hypothetical protein
VAEYRLSVRARADLLNIYAFSEAKFGSIEGPRIANIDLRQAPHASPAYQR